MLDTNQKPESTFDAAAMIAHDLHRIANAQARLVEIAEEARAERLKLAEEMKKRFQAGFQGKEVI